MTNRKRVGRPCDLVIDDAGTRCPTPAALLAYGRRNQCQWALCPDHAVQYADDLIDPVPVREIRATRPASMWTS